MEQEAFGPVLTSSTAEKIVVLFRHIPNDASHPHYYVMGMVLENKSWLDVTFILALKQENLISLSEFAFVAPDSLYLQCAATPYSAT